MKTRLNLLLLVAMIGAAATAFAQPTITFSQLVAHGFTNGPLTGYSLNVTGIRGVLFARLDNIHADAIGVRAHGGILQLYGLPYEVTLASVNTNTRILALNGRMSLPPPLKDVPALPAAEPGLVVNALGHVAFDGGTLTLPTPPYSFPFGPLTIENVSLTLDGARDVFGGGADVGIGGGPTIAFCVPQGSARIHGDFEVSNGRLNQLGVGASNLKKPLGTSGAYLDSVTATIGNLAVNGGRNWFLQGKAGVVGGGCPVADKWPWRIDAQTTVNSAGFFEILGTGYVFDIETASAYFRYNPPYTMAAGGSVNFVKNTALNGVFVADIGLQCTAGPQLSGFARGKLTVPGYVPVAGGWVFATAQASFNNSGFRGSVTVNVSPEIPSVCTPRTCLPGGCITWWSPKWSNPRRTCKRCWDGPCIPAMCTPRIPAVSATVGFRFEGGNFTFGGAAAPADPMVELWERPFHDTVVDETTGNRVCFMCNWSRLDKCSTGNCGRKIPVAAGLLAGAPPLLFELPAGEQSAMFRLTWENPNNSLVFMSIGYSDFPSLSVSTDEVSPNYRVLRPFDLGGVNFGQGAYLIIDGFRREAIIGIPNPPAGTYTVTLDHTDSLGNYAVELLRQNPAPTVTITRVSRSELPTEYGVFFSTLIGTNPATTRFLLAQTACDPKDPTRRVKAGPVYLVDTFPTVNGGEQLRYFHTDTLQIPPGDYTLIVSVDDPASLEVEAFSSEQVTVIGAAGQPAPEPVPSFALRAEVGGFTIQWEPSPSSDAVSQYIVSYTKASMPHEFEGNASFGDNERSGTITNLANGQPYLVTVFVMGTNGLQSTRAEVQRVIPTEGYGLNAPMIVSAPRKGATAGQLYVYFPEVYDADDQLRPSAPLPDGEEFPPTTEPQDGQGRQWTLITAPAGMTIDPTGVIMWTPTDQQVGDHQVTVRVTELSSLPPLQDAGSLVSPRFGEQTYILTVVGANNPPAFERNHYRFLTRPMDIAYAGETYRYVPEVLFPTNKFTLTLDDAPVGMTVVQEGTAPDTTNVVVWPVPPDATGHRVIVRAVPDLGANTTADDIVVQEFYLTVAAPSKTLPQPTVITRATPTPEGFGLRWVGSAPSYRVQRTTSLTNEPWVDISPIQAGAAVNFYVDTNLAPAHAFYRLRAASQFPSGLVTWWRAEGNHLDSFGPNHGSAFGVLPDFATGQQGTAFNFNGTSQAMSIGGADIPPPWTAAFWVKRQDAIDPSAALLTSPSFGLKLEQWQFTRQVGFTAFGIADYSFNYIAPANTWTHLAFVGTPGGTTLYTNGIFAETIAAGINLPMNILGSRENGLDHLQGQLDETTLFNRALTPMEIQQLRDTTRGP